MEGQIGYGRSAQSWTGTSDIYFLLSSPGSGRRFHPWVGQATDNYSQGLCAGDRCRRTRSLSGAYRRGRFRRGGARQARHPHRHRRHPAVKRRRRRESGKWVSGAFQQGAPSQCGQDLYQLAVVERGPNRLRARQRLCKRAFRRAHRSCGTLARAATRCHQDLYKGRSAGEGESNPVARRGIRQFMSQTFLEVRNLVKIFGKLTAVDNVSFKVEQGEVVTLLGPSGCGKTTTLRMVAGFEKPNAGEVEIAGRVVVATNRRINVPPERRGIGMVFQSYAIWPHMTVFENVAFPLKVRHANRREIKRRVEETLELVGLANCSDRPAILLSGGQQQRVSLARALVYSPSILLLDEPLSNLDAKLREQMRIELKRLQQQLGFTVLFVTHDQIEAMSLSTRLAVMNQGHIEQLGSPQEVYERPQTPFVEDFLGRILRFRGTVTEQQPNYQVVEFDGVKNVQVRVADGAEEGAVGKKVLVAIRPEDVRVERDHAPGHGNIIPCDVENILHLGREYELVLRVADRLCTITVPRESGSKVGQTIGLHLPAEHLRVWTATAALEATNTEQATHAGSAV